MKNIIIAEESLENMKAGIVSLQLALKGMESQLQPTLINMNRYMDSERWSSLVLSTSLSLACSQIKEIVESNGNRFKVYQSDLESRISRIPKLDFRNIQLGLGGSISLGGAMNKPISNYDLEVKDRNINITLRLKEDNDSSKE